MPEAYIRLHSTYSLFSTLIRFQTWSKFTHASVEVINSGFESNEEDGVISFDPRDPLLNADVKCVKMIHLTQGQAHDMREFLIKQVGCDYDFPQIIRMILRKKQSKSSRKKWFCSELVFAAFKHVGIVLLDHIDACQVTPQHLAMLPQSVAIDVTRQYTAKKHHLRPGT